MMSETTTLEWHEVAVELPIEGKRVLVADYRGVMYIYKLVGNKVGYSWKTSDGLCITISPYDKWAYMEPPEKKEVDPLAGPWKIQEYTLVQDAGNGYHIAAFCACAGDNEEQIYATRRMIKCAPEMYQFLKWVRDDAQCLSGAREKAWNILREIKGDD